MNIFKRISFALLIVFVFIIVEKSYAKDNIIEEPNLKVIIHGNIIDFSDVPIIKNGKTLLPLRQALTSLGIQNDDKHIIWNSSERSVTASNDKTKVYIKTNSLIGYINNVKTDLDAAPVIYNGKTYIPIRFIAKSFNKQITWDNKSKSIFIYDEAKVNKAKKVVNEAEDKLQSLSKYKYIETLNSNSKWGYWVNRYEVDKLKNINHSILEVYMKKGDKDWMEFNEIYLVGDNYYIKTKDNNNSSMSETHWEKRNITSQEKQTQDKTRQLLSKLSQVYFYGLNITENEEEYMLKGFTGNPIEGHESPDSNSRIEITITIDKKSKIYKEINIRQIGKNSAHYEHPEEKYNLEYNTKYLDVSENFEIQLPNNLPN
ncbi:copper amine oxidase N-terminal domain-containing protein [Pseudobacteroides cellulosolvens]|uniref:Copper amine oxidase-like domain-containing protein n=1 Tax=Pseudobacteroides cellulosolvens ATCC 35603 = DSM 2933 TaxID=398512 RepID=A0A0L6JUC2_9FIRM|nr:copper amine oxidase N-terminal domain-containing protein [Pseudobacteroides cellulosolvens]KNY29456.1 copper amine oxidase-like domain-containing protein [Pseudobacteroides cellulosolvens ATCC 35603 = DSM 2933]